MVNEMTLTKRDLAHIWHPCSQMKDFETLPVIEVTSAKGSYLHTNHGKLIDATSSWWCKSLGHRHPAVIHAINTQIDKFEHVIGANTTHESIVRLGEKLHEITGKNKVFFSSDGSSAVEVALKMAIQAQQICGRNNRGQFIALSNGYHGETLATLGISDLGLYKKPFEKHATPCHFIKNIPYVSCKQDKLWIDCETIWQTTILPQLEPIKDSTCAIIVEPIIQGAGNMRVYSADFLRRLALWARQNDIFLIADEIMTGMGRTGKWLACEHADITPDIICLSKGLTSGSLPLSTVLVNNDFYNLFYDDYATNKAFMHSHTYSGHALAVSAALATITAMENENINSKAESLGQYMHHKFQEVAKKSGKLKNIRTLGAMVAGDLSEVYANSRAGLELYQQTLQFGALLRPLGNTIYWLPPLNTELDTIDALADATLRGLELI